MRTCVSKFFEQNLLEFCWLEVIFDRFFIEIHKKSVDTFIVENSTESLLKITHNFVLFI